MRRFEEEKEGVQRDERGETAEGKENERKNNLILLGRCPLQVNLSNIKV